jgi:hypothetical protein
VRRAKVVCRSGKVTFQSQGAALRALNVQRRVNAQAVAPMPFELRGAYRCRTCGAWHLTKREDSVHT